MYLITASCYVAKQNVEQSSLVMNHLRDALKCVWAGSMCAVLFVCTRGVSYFHTSYDFKIFCDTFFNNVTVYKITLFFYQLHLVPPESPRKITLMVWILCNSWEVSPLRFLRKWSLRRIHCFECRLVSYHWSVPLFVSFFMHQRPPDFAVQAQKCLRGVRVCSSSCGPRSGQQADERCADLRL